MQVLDPATSVVRPTDAERTTWNLHFILHDYITIDPSEYITGSMCMIV